LPYKLAFEEAQKADELENCQGPPAPPKQAEPIPPGVMSDFKKGYVDALNSGLNGWFTAALSDCDHACAGKTIPILVEVSEDAGKPDHTIKVVNRAGRADAATICLLEYDEDVAVHEGGHQVLGHGDEYIEQNPIIRARDPATGRKERERPFDWSWLFSHFRFGRFALYHERHFNFVPAFLEAVLPDCKASLVEGDRPIVPDYRVTGSAGYLYADGEHGFYGDVGFDIGLPLDRMREWQVFLGTHFRWLQTLDEGKTSAFLAGARFGLEHNFAPITGGARIGGFAELGGGYVFKDVGEDFGAAYGELGLQAGYRTGFDVLSGFFGGEIAGGSLFDPSGRDIAPSGLSIDEPGDFAWFRAGLHAGLLW
jgi:hypothetical protein